MRLAHGQRCPGSARPNGPRLAFEVDDLFDELYDRYYSRVERYFCTALSDRQEAEDAAHQVFFKILRALRGAGWHGEASERWVFRIARNHAIDLQRRAPGPQLAAPEALERMVDAGDGAPLLRRLGGPAEGASLLLLLAELPETQRQVLTLRYLVGLGTREIADLLDRREGAIRMLEHRALRALRVRFGSAAAMRQLVMPIRRRRIAFPDHRTHGFSALDPTVARALSRST
jgi:RNA polymerase sigma-70 factor (ECF subfamily)